MPLFGRRQDAPLRNAAAGVPGLAQGVSLQGWQPVPGSPFERDLEDAVTEISRSIYRLTGAATGNSVVVRIAFHDGYQAISDGRTITVANAQLLVTPPVMHHSPRVVAICAVELPTIIPLVRVQPRQYPLAARWGETPTGNPAFDAIFRVASPLSGYQQLFTPEAQQRIMAHDDWVFVFSSYHLACVSKGTFASAEQISQRTAEVLGIVAALPESVVPRQIDRSQDALMARISRLTDVNDALALLQGLTPEDRDRLARSATPLAAFADCQTPLEAMARFQELDAQQRMQLMAMFTRVEDSQQGF